MHHGNGKAAPAVPLANGDVGRRALVVALQGGGHSSIWGTLEVRLEAWDKGRHRTVGEQDPDASLWLWWALPECRALGAVRPRVHPRSLRRWGRGRWGKASSCAPADLAQHVRSERKHLKEEMRKLRKGLDICDSLTYTGLNIRSRTSGNLGYDIFF